AKDEDEEERHADQDPGRPRVAQEQPQLLLGEGPDGAHTASSHSPARLVAQPAAGQVQEYPLQVRLLRLQAGDGNPQLAEYAHPPPTSPPPPPEAAPPAAPLQLPPPAGRPRHASGGDPRRGARGGGG